MANIKPCRWKGLEFPSQKICAEVLDCSDKVVCWHVNKYGNVDRAIVGSRSYYYNRDGSKCRRTTPVVWRGLKFPSILVLSLYLNCSFNCVKAYIEKGTLDDLEKRARPLLAKKSVIWRDVPFESIEACSRALQVTSEVIRYSIRRFDNIDHLVPGYKSVYYSKSEDPREQHCFVSEAIDIFGLKAVARMYDVSHTQMRRARNSDIGLLSFRVERWEGRQHTHCKFKTRDELFRAMVSPPRRPYIYLLHWTKQNMSYVGSRTAEHCNPSEINKTYFSSSRRVAAFIKQHGKPDVTYTIEYSEVNQALFAEGFCLMLISASPRYIKHYLNKVLWIPNYKDPWLCRGTRNDFLVRSGDGELKRKRQLLELLLTE